MAEQDANFLSSIKERVEREAVLKVENISKLQKLHIDGIKFSIQNSNEIVTSYKKKQHNNYARNTCIIKTFKRICHSFKFKQFWQF